MDRFSAVTAAVVGGSGGGGSVSGGSTITVTTAETELFGKNVMISQGSTSYTGTFSQTGEAVIGGVKITGDINVRATSGVKVAETSLNVPYFGNYTVSIAFWAATVTVSTTNSQFDGLTVYAKKDGVTMASAVFSGGSSTLTVPDAGTYTFETTYEWKTYTSAELSVTEQTSYSTTLNGFFATINITTPTPEFYSGTVVVTSTGVPTTSISLDASGEGTYTALQAGDYLFTLTYGGEPYTASVTVSAETTYSAVIKMWTATIVVSTTSSELDGQTVTLENGVGTVIDTGVFSSGSVTFSVHETGTYTASVTYDNYTYTDSVTVSAETSYSATLDTWNATLAITSTTPEFASQTVTITKGGVTVGTVALVSGSASFVVHEAGTYTCTITYSGESYVGTAVVSSQTSYPVSINMWTATLSISTTSSELYGATITITDGNGATVGTTTFDNTGAASFRVHETGTYTASVTYDGHTYTASTTVSAETTYLLTLDTWNATITITTTESSFYGETITITKGATTIGTTTFSNLGVATYTAHETGTYTFTVTVSGTPYSTDVVVTAQTSYSVSLNAYKIYGFHVDSAESDPSTAVSYQVQYDGKNVDNYSYSPAYMDFANDVFVSGDWDLADDFFIPRPCMLKYDGTVDYYLDPDDYTKKADGVTASDVTDSNYGGNAMVEFGRDGKKIWYKLVPDSRDATSYTCYFSDEQLDSDFHCWPFIDANGNKIDHFYIAAYQPCNVNNKLRSLSGVYPITSVTGVNRIQYAKANDIHSSNEWNCIDFGELTLINLLHVLISKTINSQAAFGNGVGGKSIGGGASSGTLNAKGLFYGTNANFNVVVKTFGIENWWGNLDKLIVGAQLESILSSGGVTWKYKLTYSTADGSTQTGYVETDNTASTGYLTGPTLTSNISSYYLKKSIAYSNGALLPYEDEGSSSTYYADTFVPIQNASGSIFMSGGDLRSTYDAGAFSVNAGGTLSNDFWGSTGSLSCKPLAA